MVPQHALGAIVTFIIIMGLHATHLFLIVEYKGT